MTKVLEGIAVIEICFMEEHTWTRNCFMSHSLEVIGLAFLLTLLRTITAV